MADYCTEAQAKSLGFQTDALSATAWALLVTGASRLFDNLCEVPDDFFAAASGVYADRTFVGDGTAYLKLPPYVALSLTDPVMINEGTIDDADFVSDNVPDYAEQDGMLVVLDRTVRRNFSPTGIDRFVGWPDGKQIEVTADWGFSAIPKEVTLATAQIALAQWRTSDPTNAEDTQASQVLIDGLPPYVWNVVEKMRATYSEKALFA